MSVQDRIEAMRRRLSRRSSDERLIVHQLAFSLGKYNINYYTNYYTNDNYLYMYVFMYVFIMYLCT